MADFEITDSDGLLDVIAGIREDFKRSGKVTGSWKAEGTMTPTQRGSLHVWLEMLAEVLNSGGFDQTTFFKQYAKEGMQAPWTKHSCKEIFYKPTLEAMTGKESTESMSTREPSEICEVIGKVLAERLGIEPPPWPTRFNEFAG